MGLHPLRLPVSSFLCQNVAAARRQTYFKICVDKLYGLVNNVLRGCHSANFGMLNANH